MTKKPQARTLATWCGFIAAVGTAQCFMAAASHGQELPEIGSTGVYYDIAYNDPGSIGFYEDAAGTSFLGFIDPDDVTNSVRPCDGDGRAEAIASSTTLPSTLASADFDGFGANILAPSATSGHCFYRLDNGEFVAVTSMDPGGETSPISPTRLWWLPGTAEVTATGFSFSANGGVPAITSTAVPAIPLIGLAALGALLGLGGVRRLKG